MSPHRPAFTLALATALVGVAPLPLAADEPEEPVLRCFTEALTIEEIEDGVYSEIECYPIDEAPAFRGVSAATIYDGALGAGTSLTVTSAGTCTGFGINFAPADWWNDRITSTELLACGNAKHWENNSNSGANQLISGTGVVQNLNATMNNQTTSIQYAP
jgi:hypothetical protein